MANKLFLLKELVKRDVLQRYRGSFLGILWSFLTPLILLSVYSFVFIFVLGARFGAENPSSTHAVLMIFSGLIIHMFFAECLSRGTTIILANPNLVKKVVFPLFLLPYSVVLSSLVNLFISTLILSGAVFFLFNISPTILFSVVVFIPLIIMSLGFALFFAAMGVYIRDLAHITSLLSTILLFLSPAFFARENAPAIIKDWLVYNPITIPMEEFRKVVIENQLPDFMMLAVYSIFAVLIFIFGSLWFHKTSKGFADVV